MIERRTRLGFAAAPFAPTSFARLRLIRQMHACGLLSGEQAARDVADPEPSRPARRVLADGSPRASC